MNFRAAHRVGHWPTLIVAFLGLELCFMIWALLAPLSETFGKELGLSTGQKSWVVALPFLMGALLCPLFGLLADRWGARRTVLLSLALTALPLLMGWLLGKSYPQLLVLAALLGVAGANFAVMIPLVGRWYPLESQGLVLGFLGMGCGGMAISALFVPGLMPVLGSHGIFGTALISLLVLWLLAVLLVREAPMEPSRRPSRVTVSRDFIHCAGFNFLTLGLAVGLLIFAPFFFKEQYGVAPLRAGLFVGFCSLVGAALRPVGGYLSDRLGGVVMLFLCFLGLGFLGMWMSYLPHLEVATLCLFLAVALLGIGNGAVFQLMPLHSQESVGLGAGIVVGAGALGGCLIPLAFALSYLWTGRFGPGFFHLGMIGFAAAGFLIQVTREGFARPEGVPVASRATGVMVAVRERSLGDVALKHQA